jgi:hypothetical protein
MGFQRGAQASISFSKPETVQRVFMRQQIQAE